MADIRGKRGATPLEYANKPNFDAIAARGINGIMDVVKKGVVPNSDTGHLSLLGYDLKKYYPGRGPLEALGAGIKLKEGDVAFRANIATVDKNLKVIDRRAGRIRDDLSELEKAVNDTQKDPAFTQSGLHAEIISTKDGPKIQLTHSGGNTLKILSAEEFLKLRDSSHQEDTGRGKILDQKF